MMSLQNDFDNISISLDLNFHESIPRVHSEIILNEQLDLDNFKTNNCNYTIQHNHKHCFYFHNEKDQKRKGFNYSSQICSYILKKKKCPSGEICDKSHNRVEQLFRPDKYKTKFCTFYPNKLKECEYGQFCCFAHSEKEIRVELIHNFIYDEDFYMFHYKTAWCPFNLSYHNKSLCVYAHNWQDFRRKPESFDYEPVSCPKWKIKEYITKYDDGCSNGDKCDKCHGWKELEYHPLCYKAKPCPLGIECPKKRDCTHFHNFSEQREVSKLAIYKITKYYPRNRLTSETFKKNQRFYHFLNEVGLVPNGSESGNTLNSNLSFGNIKQRSSLTLKSSNEMLDLLSFSKLGNKNVPDDISNRRISLGNEIKEQISNITKTTYIRKNNKKKSTIIEAPEYMEHPNDDINRDIYDEEFSDYSD